MAGVAVSGGVLSEAGAAATTEPPAYGAGGYGSGPFPGTTGAVGAGESVASSAVVGTLAGEQRSGNAWNTVELPEASGPPVVISQGVTGNGGHPVHVRVRDVNGEAFSYRFEEWEHYDGFHTYEEVGYVAVPQGVHALANGEPLVSGTVRSTHEWTGVSFARAFDEPPVVFAQSQTFEGYQAIVSRVRNVTATGFETRLQEEEALGRHNEETVGYVALPAGRTTVDGTPVEVGTTGARTGSDWTRVAFEGSYGDPSVVAGLQTTNGLDTAAVRVRNVDADGMEVVTDEERSADAETTHVAEDVGYLVLDRE